MFDFLKKLDPLVHFVLLVAVGVLGFLFVKNSKQIESLRTQLAQENTQIITKEVVSQVPAGDSLSEEEVRNIVNEIVSGIPKSSETVVEKYVTSPKTGTDYIPVGATFTTTATSWTDVPGGNVYIDLANDYSSSAYVTWQASLKVAHGNGQALARLYDATNNIAVSGSEISTTSGDLTFVSSGSLPLWAGNNLYKVQVRSLNSFEVTYDSGKIKVVY